MKSTFTYLLICILAQTLTAQLTSCGVSPCSISANLLANGDFELGNTGFSSALNNRCMCAGNSYCVAASPNPGKCVNSLWQNIPAPSGTLFMIVDGSANVDFWSQTINGLTLNTVYYFSFLYHPNISTGGTPNIELRVNGVTVGNTTGTSGGWSEHCFSWTANSTTANLSIVQTTSPQFSDFAIDRVFFGECVTVLNNSILNFQGNSISNYAIHLDWNLDNIETIRHLELEYSTDGISFESILHTTQIENYGSYQYQTIHKYNYFRIKTINLQGDVALSRVIQITQPPPPSKSIQVYPNPASAYLNIVLPPSMSTRGSTITLIDALGRTIQTSVSKQTNKWILDTQTLSGGIYSLIIQTPMETWIERVEIIP